MYLILLSIYSVGCMHTQQNTTADETMKSNPKFSCWIYPSGVLSDTYLVELSDEGILIVQHGERSDDAKNLLKTYKSKSKELKKSELSQLDALLLQSMEMKPVERGALKKGGWEIKLGINGRLYHFYYGNHKDSPIDKIIDMLRKLSPIEIDIHSWS